MISAFAVWIGRLRLYMAMTPPPCDADLDKALALCREREDEITAVSTQAVERQRELRRALEEVCGPE